MRKDQSKEELTIRVELVKRQMSVAELAEAVGVSRGYMYDFLHGARKGVELRKKIYKFLNLQ